MYRDEISIYIFRSKMFSDILDTQAYSFRIYFNRKKKENLYGDDNTHFLLLLVNQFVLHEQKHDLK